MVFPVSVQFNRRLITIITPDNQSQVLQYIKKSVLEKKADNVWVDDMQVTYQGSTSNGRGSLFGSVDKGVFNLHYKNNCWYLHYQIYMRKLFIGTATISAFLGAIAGVIGNLWWAGPCWFLWLCGGNWIIYVLRHELVVTNMAVGIDELIVGKEQLAENDERLKSWF